MHSSPKHPVAASNHVGLCCRKCGAREFRVIYTRPARDGKIIRRRACRQCGARVTTWERTIGG
jgi:transcriptional regulator NrdR family protein